MSRKVFAIIAVLFVLTACGLFILGFQINSQEFLAGVEATVDAIETRHAP